MRKRSVAMAVIILFFAICADVYLSNKAHQYIVDNDGFFDEHLANYKRLNEYSSFIYCRQSVVMKFYKYQVCFIRYRGEDGKLGDAISLIYQKPRPLFLSFGSSASEYFERVELGERAKILDSKFNVVYTNDRWKK